MARTPALDRPGALRALGVVMLALLILAVYATYAVFTKQFSGDVPVTIRSESVGLQLNRNADVKLRGVIVGRVSDITSDTGRATIHLMIDPDYQPLIPSDVEALIVPKTLFGEKFVDLQPVAASAGTPIESGDVIAQADLPAEVETLLVDLDPILTALNPADLSYTLNAVAEALDGQGEAIGASLETLEAYLQKITPLAPRIVEDITLLGETAQTYADVMPEVGQTLRNAVVTGNTLTGRKAQLQALFVETAAFATTADAFLDRTGDDLITLARQSRPTLELLADYAPTIGCVLKGVDRLKPRIDSAFRDNRAHVTVEFAARSPRAYDRRDAADLPPVSGGGSALDPTCSTLPSTPYDGSRPAPGMSNALLRQLGIDGPLGKAAPLVAPARVSPAGSQAEEEQIDAVLAPALGVAAEDVPDVAQALVGPVLRGAEVTFG
ncbi:MCE family protein [Mumia sp. zg.B17]|uniref:MCE family protein n=2 Tax=Mumia TaxID=1546255 RepID=UPI001C6E157B|nr:MULTISPECIES: MCE family protein [unclassified Mumia]MBW9204651.1 MCE family protein [Mumia sp. zg.B17]MBW9209344.1 MCE family protein [Mumia sp. zg.B21]